MNPLERFFDAINRSPSRNAVWAILTVFCLAGVYYALQSYASLGSEGVSAKVLFYVVLWLSATFHEYSHALAAYGLGDDTAKRMGRLTLNPLKHLDPLGILAMFLIGIGWAKPVPIVPMRFRRPYIDFMWTALAGPASNLLLLLVSWSCFRSLLIFNPEAFSFLRTNLMAGPGGGPFGTATPEWQRWLFLVGWYVFHLNILLAVFNMIPIPPLDGSRVLLAALPDDLKPVYFRIEPFGYIILLILIALNFTPWFHVAMRSVLSHVAMGMQVFL